MKNVFLFLIVTVILLSMMAFYHNLDNKQYGGALYCLGLAITTTTTVFLVLSKKLKIN